MRVTEAWGAGLRTAPQRGLPPETRLAQGFQEAYKSRDQKHQRCIGAYGHPTCPVCVPRPSHLRPGAVPLACRCGPFARGARGMKWKMTSPFAKCEGSLDRCREIQRAC